MIEGSLPTAAQRTRQPTAPTSEGEASIRLMRGYTRTGKWPEPILTSPDPQRGRSPSPSDEWSDG